MNGRRAGGSAETAVATLAHALRSPLAIIVGYAQLLRQRDDPVVHAEAPVTIVEAAERLGAAIDDLLVVVAADAGALDVEPVRLSLQQVVADAVAAATARVETGCTFDLRPGEQYIEVEADEEHLRRATEHLLANAARRAPKASVVVDVRATDDFAEIAIRDAGPPIPAREFERIFDRFATAGNEAARLTGLELYVVRLLVERHGGNVRVESDDGGATFSATLPLAR